MRLGNKKSSDFRRAILIHFCTASRAAGVISNRTGRWGLCCITTARKGDLVAMAGIPDLERNEVAPAKLAVDAKVKEGKLAYSVLHLKTNAKSPDVLDLKRSLLADDLAFVPRRTKSGVGCGSHDGLHRVEGQQRCLLVDAGSPPSTTRGTDSFAPRRRTRTVGHEQLHAKVGSWDVLFNDAGRAQHGRWRNSEALLPGRLRIYDEVEFSRLIDRQVTRICPV